MRNNSGRDESRNNNHDPTLKELEGKKGPAQAKGEMSGESFDNIVGNVKEKGEDPSPDDRARGEVSSKEGATT